MSYLLDASVLIPACWGNHQDHDRVIKWLRGKTLTLCPLVQLAFLRFSMQQGADSALALSLLHDFTKTHEPRFLPDDCDAAGLAPVQGHKQWNDLYLARLAQTHHLKLAALDQRISHPAVEVIV